MAINVQYDNKFDKLLLHADYILDNDAKEFFQKIKKDFADLPNNPNPHEYLFSCLIQLNRFLVLYSLKFSKEDHIALFELIYSFLFVKNLQYDSLLVTIKILIELLRKKNKLLREDLMIPWKPLYDFYCDQYSSKTIQAHKLRNQGVLMKMFEDFLFLAKVYFPAEANKEIYDFVKPKLYPFNTVSILKSHRILFLFLPHFTVSDLTEYSYKYWLDDLMTSWMIFRKTFIYEMDIMLLLSSLAACNIGYIDWEPYLPFVYSKILLSLNLPVYYENKNYSDTYLDSTTNISVFIINTLDENNSSIKYFSNLMQTIESYYYPANIGPSFIKLGIFLRKLSVNLINRLRLEKFPKKRHFYIKVNEERRLTDKLIDQFFLVIKPILIHSLLTLEAPDDNTSILSNFATIRPDIVVPLVLDKFYSLTDTSTEPKKLTAVIVSVYHIIRFLVCIRDDTDRRHHVFPILMTSLQWIDFNDIPRCGNALVLIKGIVQMIPLVDCSSAVEFYSDLSENDRIICNATSMFEDFVLQFFDRIFTAIDQIHNENFRSNRVNYDIKITQNKYCNFIWSVVPIILANSHPTISEKSLSKFIRYIDDRIYDDELSATMLGLICKSFFWIYPEYSLKKLMPFLITKIKPHLNEIKPTDVNLSSEFLYFFTILSNGILVSGIHLIPYMTELIFILNKTLYLEHETGQQLACSLLTALINCFGSYYHLNISNFQIPLDTPIKDHLFIRDWGKTYSFTEFKCNWHVPNNEEITNIQRLVTIFLFPQYTTLHNYVSNENVSATSLKIPLKIMLAFFKCDVFPNWNDEPRIIVNYEKELSPFIIDRKLKFDLVTIDGKNVKKLFSDLLIIIENKLLLYIDGSSVILKQLSKILGLLFNSNNMVLPNFIKFDTCKHIENRLNECKKNIRLAFLAKVCLRFNSHVKVQVCKFTETSRRIMYALFILATCAYIDLHQISKCSLMRFMKFHQLSLQLFIPEVVAILKLGDPSKYKNQITGCLILLFSDIYLGSKFITIPRIPIVREIWKACLVMKNTGEIAIISMLNKITASVVDTFVPIEFFKEIPITCFNSLLKFCFKDNVPDSIKFESFLLSLRSVSDKSNRELNDILAEFLEILQNNQLYIK